MQRKKMIFGKGTLVLGAFINALSWDEVINAIVAWGESKESRYICICNVHSVVTATLDPEFKTIINEADIATPDGAPVAWALRKLGFLSQKRINGPDLMWKYLSEAERIGQTVFFYGSTEETLADLKRVVFSNFPCLKLGGTHSPPYRPLTEVEDEAEVRIINDSGAQVIFIGLGCPKQEKWMAAHRGRVNGVMIGVGAAFDYHSGAIKRAPLWMQHRGLEWFYRLSTEPRRLLRRYFFTNSIFVFKFSTQLLTRAWSKSDQGQE